MLRFRCLKKHRISPFSMGTFERDVDVHAHDSSFQINKIDLPDVNVVRTW